MKKWIKLLYIDGLCKIGPLFKFGSWTKFFDLIWVEGRCLSTLTSSLYIEIYILGSKKAISVYNLSIPVLFCACYFTFGVDSCIMYWSMHTCTAEMDVLLLLLQSCFRILSCKHPWLVCDRWGLGWLSQLGIWSCNGRSHLFWWNGPPSNPQFGSLGLLPDL